jgi:hypothetical protein
MGFKERSLVIFSENQRVIKNIKEEERNVIIRW